MTDAALFASGPGLKIALVAGEASGDIMGSVLMEELQRRLPAVRFAGIGGRRMLELGFRSIVPMELLSVMGYVEVIKRLPALLSARRRLIRALLREKPDLVIGIDAPDFNFAVERACKEAGIPSIHYVSPSIWAWRREKIHTLRRSTDHVLCLFPMEPELYAPVGLAATFIGHPLADRIPLQIDVQAARAALGLSPGGPVVTILPGSRLSEVRRIGPAVIEAASELHRIRPGIRFLVPLPTEETRAAFVELLAERAEPLPIKVLEGQSHEAMAAADVVLVKSGTSTLEAALFKKPMVITYKVAPLTAWLMKRKAYLPWVGLPNILLNDSVVPELLQDDATGPKLAAAVLRWLDDDPAREDLRKRFEELHLRLKQGAAGQAADVVMAILERSKKI